MSNISSTAISPELVAARLAAAKNLIDTALTQAIQDEPRIPELLWQWQWHSFQPGGLEKAAQSIVDTFSTSFGPSFLHGGVEPTLEQRRQAFFAMPLDCQTDLLPPSLWTSRTDSDYRPGFRQVYLSPNNDEEKNQFSAALMRLPLDEIADVFLDYARRDLPNAILSMLAENRNFPGTSGWRSPARWYCNNLLEVLIEALDAHAGRVQNEIAQTELRDLVWDRLEYACAEKRLVKVNGQARTGKTESVHAWAKAYPVRSSPRRKRGHTPNPVCGRTAITWTK